MRDLNILHLRKSALYIQREREINEGENRRIISTRLTEEPSTGESAELTTVIPYSRIYDQPDVARMGPGKRSMSPLLNIFVMLLMPLFQR